MRRLIGATRCQQQIQRALCDLPPDRALTFLLRCHKGRFYRNRDPSLSLVQGGGS